MNQEHHNKEVVNNNKGIDQDLNGEISKGTDTGKYYDAQNMRLSDENGDKGILKKINGETLIYPKSQPTGTYVCIGNVSVNSKLIEFWVEETASDDPIITVDGVIHGKSPDMPWLIDYPLQTDKNENCKGGEIFVTDFNTPPMIFNLQDIIDNLATQKYFDEFNPALYSINLEAPMDIPVFVELVNIGGGGGLPVGSYQYSLRYSNEAGDKTNWGPLTPPIPVVQNNSSASTQYPYVRTYGADTNNALATSYGPLIRYRVTNLANYEYVEIRRIAYDIEGGLDYVPGGEIIAKIPIGEEEISIREFIDPVDSNVEITLADSEETNIMNYIAKAKAIRYHDKRLVLMNIETPDRDAEPTFKEINGNKIFPIVKALGKAGHNDPHQHTYYKNYMSGEKHSFGVNFFDGSGGQGFTVGHADLNNVQTPNRRNPASADSELYSYEGMATAADTTCVNVGSTFEIFDLEDAVAKDDICSFINILDAGTKTALAIPGVDDYCPTPAASRDCADIGYNPFTPTNQNDTTVTSHNFKINTQVNPGSGYVTYNPQGFAPNYFSRGFALGGVEDIPSWAKSFSIVKSKAADRVVFQGIGMYSMIQGDFVTIGNASCVTKEANKLWFHSPDIEKGLIPQEVIDDINSNPSSYKIQLISPLGFMSEVYGYEEEGGSERDRIVDMITYARVLHDEGQINVGETANMGINDGSGNRYVTYNKYRSQTDIAGGGPFSLDGDTLIDIDTFLPISEGRGNYYEITSTTNIYSHTGTGGTGSNDFEDTGCEDFTEPFYIVNIIQTGKEVRDLNINQYRSTGFYQKIDSIIGVGDDTTDQEFLLVDERWEDCIPALSGSSSFASDESFIYLEDENLIRKAYICSTYMSAPTKATIDADIIANGFWVSGSGINVYGRYSHTNSLNKEFTLVFDQGYNPSSNERIIVKYDTRLPLQVFGGDTTVSENIFAPIDREVDGEDNSDKKDLQFILNAGFPFRAYELNPRRYVVVDPTSVNKVQDNNRARLAYIRQMCIMYACENRIGAEYSYGLTYPFQHFPQTNYVVRPNKGWNDSNFPGEDPAVIASDNNIYSTYFDDYPQEWLNWSWGGFRFLPKTNLDYNVKGPILYFSKPAVGFKTENQFCTRVTWSLPRQINVQDSPSLKSFPASNIFDISDKNGRIAFAWDAQTGQSGENLYAITNSGICLLLTKKSVLSNLTGEDLSIMATDSFINAEYWISNNVGAPGENWRGIADSNIEIRTESGIVRSSALFIPNKESLFRLLSNQVVDIAGDSYKKTLRPILEALPSDYSNKMNSVFNRLNNEYWLQMGDKVFVYDQNENAFVGKFTYDFDRYTFHKNKVYASRDLSTYILNSGFEINGLPIEAFLINRTAAPMQPIEKEFISINIATGYRGTMKPSEVQFLHEDTLAVQCALNQALAGPTYLKQYDGWFQFIPRKDALVSINRERLQSRMLFFKIIHNFEEDFKIINTVIQSKNIK